MSNDERLTLRSGDLEMVLLPLLGGSIARLDLIRGERCVPILRPTPPGPANVLETANFPLVPYCNRIRDGRFTFRGRDIEIACNMAGDPSPLHGDGWLAPWQVVQSSRGAAELLYRHTAGEWPWDYEARQHFELRPDGLAMRLTCRNLSDQPMPCGLGHHPYFPCTGETRLDTIVTDVWTIDEKVLPVEKVPATGRYDLKDRTVCGQGLDHGFGGWGGRVRISGAPFPCAVEITSEDAQFFQLYSPEQGGLFVAEPVSHANAALNEPEERWPELGLRVLEPGEEMSLSARLTLIFD